MLCAMPNCDDSLRARIARHLAEFEVVAKNPLGEEVAASLSLSRGHIFIRGAKHLWCLGK